MNDLVIDARDITKTLGRGAGQVKALRGVDVALRKGELTLLMGPSGSGKTTLLLILGCMLTPSSGTLTVCGASTSDADKETLARIRRDHIGFVFQSYHLFPTMTARQNVQLALDIRGHHGRDAARKSREALALVGLEHKDRSLPEALSGGEQQRVAIARAFVANPSVILADEPTSALDSDNGRTIMRILADAAHDRDRAVLVVTHDPRIVPFADRIIRIEDGLLAEEKPAHPEKLDERTGERPIELASEPASRLASERTSEPGEPGEQEVKEEPADADETADAPGRLRLPKAAAWP